MQAKNAAMTLTKNQNLRCLRLSEYRGEALWCEVIAFSPKADSLRYTVIRGHEKQTIVGAKFSEPFESFEHMLGAC